MAEKYQKRIDALVAEMTASYYQEQTVAPCDFAVLPNRGAIIRVANQLRRLLFPGYFEESSFQSEVSAYYVGGLLTEIYEGLRGQILLAFRHQMVREDCFADVDLEEKADETCLQFLDTLPKIRAYLVTDVEAAFDGDPAASSKDEIIFSYPGLFVVTIHRLAHELYLLGVPLIPRIMGEYAHGLTGVDIHPGAAIGKYFFIDHGTGVVIGETTHIADNVKLYQGVTLGALSTRGGQALRGVKRHPTLEEGVTVYSGTSILGGETVIGKGAVIGSNVFITRSISAGTRVSMKDQELLIKDRKF